MLKGRHLFQPVSFLRSPSQNRTVSEPKTYGFRPKNVRFWDGNHKKSIWNLLIMSVTFSLINSEQFLRLAERPCCHVGWLHGLQRLMENRAYRQGYDTKTGAFLPSCLFADKGVQGIHHLFKHALKPSLAEIVIDGLPSGEVRGKHTPLAAGLVDIKDCIHYLSE